MLKFYYTPGSCSLVPHTALHWAKAEFEAVRMEREQLKSPEFLAMNPQGTVPVLTDDDWVLTQNLGIFYYLDAQYPQAHIFGSGYMRQKARARQWLGIANSDLHSKYGLIFGAERYVSSETAQQELRENAISQIKAIYDQADKVLARREFLAADEITVGDVYFYVTERWAEKLGINLGEFKNLAAHYNRVEHNAGVQAALKEQGLL